MKVISTMRDAVLLIKKQQEEVRVKAEVRHIQWGLDEKRYREQERIRRGKEAYDVSLVELISIMVQWVEDKHIEQLFREVGADVSMLEEKQGGQTAERLSLVRQFLSVDTAIERLLKWQTPQEIPSKE